jgi:prepilin-type N-terminal cleavage/methylation domain-containing protein
MSRLNRSISPLVLSGRSRGYTLTEILVVVGVLALLGAIALPAYQSYVAKAHSSELAVTFDVVRTKVAVAVKVGGVKEQCADVATSFNLGNLQSDYAAMDVAFEAVPGGFTPVMRFCSAVGNQGVRGVDVARETYNLLSKSASIGQGAVIGDAAVSFSVGLVDGAVACKVAPPVAKSSGACSFGFSALLAPTTPQVPTVAASNPATTASTAVVTTTPVQKPPAVCAASTPQQLERKVMLFGPALTGYVMNQGDLQTGGDMKNFTAEVSVVGGDQVATTAGHGATLLSYATHASTNEFLVWDPSSIKITFHNSDITTGVNINDGRNHRVTVSWQSASGALVLYDNGVEVWRKVVNQGGTLGGNGKLVLGQDQDSYGGGFGTNDAFQGKIITASLANVAATGGQIAAGPLHTAITPSTGLIANVVLDQNGNASDTTQKHTFATGGNLVAVTQMVDTSLYVTSNCQ